MYIRIIFMGFNKFVSKFTGVITTMLVSMKRCVFLSGQNKLNFKALLHIKGQTCGYSLQTIAH